MYGTVKCADYRIGEAHSCVWWWCWCLLACLLAAAAASWDRGRVTHASPSLWQVEVLHLYGHPGAKALADPVSAETSALATEGVTMRPPDLPMAPTNVRVIETLPIVVANGVRSAELEVCFALQPTFLSCRPQPLARANLGMPSLYGLSRADGLRFAAWPPQCATACRSLGTRAKC